MPTKILVLHGYGQCAYYAFRKLAPVIAECRDQVKFYFLDAPMIMVPVDPKAHFGNTTDAQYTLKPVPTCSTPTTRPSPSQASRAWFKINDVGRDNLPNIEETWFYLREILKEHRFDAIFGFSQGAAMAEQIAAMLERPYLFPMFCQNGVAPHPPLKFIACVSGFLIRGPKLSWEADSKSKAAIAAPEFGFALNTPVLYVVGRNDIVVPLERSHIFVQHSKFNRVEEHNGGHFIPLQHKWQKFFVSFFLNPFAEISSPTPSLPTSTDEDFVTPRPRIETYQTGRALPRPVDDRNTLYEEEEEEPFLFSVVYDSGSDSESDEHRSIYSSPSSSPPDTPYMRTPQLPVLELEEPGISMSSKYDLDEVADLFPALGLSDVELVKSKL
ncbi:hypothetical protein BT96DRAFT_879408 [Gymnopus androsaceus JB14]|uniref:Serine hydrolase domain-containing protein n=1 Tax=Gymnopus androsaceus JB14 TaxID=1447944 RepID=A0A6A4HZZ2_9AGAR|nr:hypothetical protein BT96DRAFT_879408 [Gymnopus androsaceus JB14]